MKQLRFTGLMLKPSLMSAAFCLAIAGIILAVSAISFSVKSGLLYDYLLGPNSSSQLIEISRGAFEAFSQTVFGNPLLNKILFLVFWMVIGLVVYLALTGIGTGVSSANETVQEIQYASSHKKRLDEDLKFRIILRVVALLLWFLYAVFFFKIFAPFSILAGHIAVGNLGEPLGWFYGLISIVVLTVSLHLHVVLTRFLMLRPRLIGGWDDILSEELEH